MLSVTFLIPTRACSSCFHRANGDGGIIKAMHITFTWTFRGCGILNGKSQYVTIHSCSKAPTRYIQIYIHKSPFSHGFPMVFPWFSHGFPMVFPWFSMVFPWFSHGFPKLIIHKPLSGPIAPAPAGTAEHRSGKGG